MAPNGIHFSCSYRTGDPATVPPLSVATSANLSLQIQFSDGTVRDFSKSSACRAEENSSNSVGKFLLAEELVGNGRLAAIV